jgi:hypothetical protein
MQKITEMALGNVFRRRKSWTLEPVCLTLILMYMNSVVGLIFASVTEFMFVFISLAECSGTVCFVTCTAISPKFDILDVYFNISLYRVLMDQRRI